VADKTRSLKHSSDGKYREASRFENKSVRVRYSRNRSVTADEEVQQYCALHNGPEKGETNGNEIRRFISLSCMQAKQEAVRWNEAMLLLRID
jgi:hypothetical protein